MMAYIAQKKGFAMRYAVLFVLLCGNLFASDIFLKSGDVVLNANITFENEYRIFIDTAAGVKIYERSEIEYLKPAAYQPDQPTTFTKRQALTPETDLQPAANNAPGKSSSVPGIIAGISGIVLALDMIIDSQIDDLDKGIASRKRVMGIGVLTLSGIGLVVSLDR